MGAMTISADRIDAHLKEKANVGTMIKICSWTPVHIYINEYHREEAVGPQTCAKYTPTPSPHKVKLI